MNDYFLKLMQQKPPNAIAYINGSYDYPGIKGVLKLYGTKDGTLVSSEVFGLPFDWQKPFRVYAYHIHSGTKCTGNSEDPFKDTLGHFNPQNNEHPYHEGDLAPLFGNYGFAWNAVFTARFTISDVIGKTIVIHENTDDFITQPSGNSGTKIACGVIEANF